MQEDLSRLARELRKETCPPRVIHEARQRISSETRLRPRLRLAIPMVLAGSLLLFGLLICWRLADARAGRRTEWVAQRARHRMEIARQAETALGLFGAVLQDAGSHSEAVISDRAIPPLRNGLENAKNRIIRHTKL